MFLPITSSCNAMVNLTNIGNLGNYKYLYSIFSVIVAPPVQITSP